MYTRTLVARRGNQTVAAGFINVKYDAPAILLSNTKFIQGKRKFGGAPLAYLYLFFGFFAITLNAKVVAAKTQLSGVGGFPNGLVVNK